VSSTKDDDPDDEDENEDCADESGGDGDPAEDLSADEREPDSTSEPS